MDSIVPFQRLEFVHPKKGPVRSMLEQMVFETRAIRVGDLVTIQPPMRSIMMGIEMR
jgi:hypothetical protein